MPGPSTTSVTELANGAAGLVVVVSGVLAGMARSFAILCGFSVAAVERATAIGFLAGAAFAMAMLGFEVAGR